MIKDTDPAQGVIELVFCVVLVGVALDGWGLEAGVGVAIGLAVGILGQRWVTEDEGGGGG